MICILPLLLNWLEAVYVHTIILMSIQTARTTIIFIFNEFPENGIARIMKRRISKRENFRS